MISDEAHRSIGGNARGVFEYFIGYKLGLTATPRDYNCEQEPGWLGAGRKPDFFCAGPHAFWCEVKSLAEKVSFTTKARHHDELRERLEDVEGNARAAIPDALTPRGRSKIESLEGKDEGAVPRDTGWLKTQNHAGRAGCRR